MSKTLLNLLIDRMDAKSNPCAKHLKQAANDLTSDELSDLEKLIDIFQKQGFSLDFQCSAYQQVLDMTIQESKYFMEHGSYRYSTFEEVADKVYFNEPYMKNYMIGLALTQYLWAIHKNCYQYFTNSLENIKKCDNYVEIGPGHGGYFYQAVKSGKFTNCTAIDVSTTSLAMTKAFVESHDIHSRGTNVQYLCKDVNSIAGEALYDFLVMCEVLEHVEEPEKILRSLRRILKKDGMAYFSIPINAPEIDHIKLFKSPDEVTALLNNTGFVIKEQKLFCSNGNKLERALKFNEPILMCVFVA